MKKNLILNLWIISRICFTAILLIPLVLNAQIEITSDWVTGAPITPNTSFAVQDSKYDAANFPANSSTIDQDLSVKNLIVFEIDKDNHKVRSTSTGTLKAMLEIKLWNGDTDPNDHNAYTIMETKTLTINYDGDQNNKSEYRDLLEYEGYYKVEINVTNVVDSTNNITDWPPLKVYSEIVVERKYQFNCNILPTSNVSTTSPVSDFVTIGWDNIIGAQEYDLEWSFYDAESVVGNETTSGGGGYPDLGWLFTNNASRITTGNNNFKLTLLYPEGWLFYRLRGVRYDATGRREYTQWSSAVSETLSAFPHKYQVAWHESGLNWQAQITFAEEGKNIPGIKYFDGSLRERQAVTYSHTIGTTIAGQTIYDSQGRPAVSVMPAPTFETTIGFDPNLAAIAQNTPYTKGHFEKPLCSDFPDQMSTAHGAAKYYSENNPQKTIGFNKYIPDAEGFPFTVTEFTPDQTGRIKRQSGVGDEFKLGNDHETKYFYAIPEQWELDRLFGNEVGHDSHYLKNMVVDPNGQVSVSYVDAHGRTIATALAGDSTANTNALPNFESQIQITRDLLNNIKSDYAITSTYTLAVSSLSDQDFDYSLSPTAFQPSCLAGTDVCYDCLYDLEIRVSDNCGNSFNSGTPYVYTEKNYTVGSAPDLTCTNLPTGFNKVFSLLNLDIGEYHITKTLSVSQTALKAYVEDFITHATCIPTEESMINQYQSQIDFSGCDLDCESCKNLLGDEATHINNVTQYIITNGGTPTAEDITNAEIEYAAMVAECAELCVETSECDVYSDMLKGDVSPGGQYATFEVDELTGVITIADPYSVFKDDTNDYKDATYLKPDGITPDKVWYNGADVDPATLPIADFISNWQPYWADALVDQHPEYACMVEWCDGDYEVYNSFDSLMNEIETFQEAVDANILDPNGFILGDTFFTVGGIGEDYIDSLAMFLSNETGSVCVPLSTQNLITLSLNCGEPGGARFGEGTAAELNYQWQILRAIYQGYKEGLKTKLRNSIPQCNNPTINCIEDETCNDINLKYKRRRILKIAPQSSPISTKAIVNAEGVIILNDFANECATNCELFANIWMNDLEGCNLLDADSIAIRAGLIEVCKNGCDAEHPFGSSTTANGDSTSLGDSSFDEVLTRILGTQSLCDTSCHANLISFPGSFENPQYLGPTTTPINCDDKDCVCLNLTDLEETVQ